MKDQNWKILTLKVLDYAVQSFPCNMLVNDVTCALCN